MTYTPAKTYAQERAEKMAGLSEIAQDIAGLRRAPQGKSRGIVTSFAILRPQYTQGQIRAAIRECQRAGL